MLTKLICNGQPLTGKVVFQSVSDSSESFSILAEQNSISFSLSKQILDRLPSAAQTGNVRTINNIPPSDWDGNFLLLGSLCTSVIDGSQGNDQLSDIQVGSNSLVIFDGCYACGTCRELAQLQQDIQGCSIWINGLKDCNLYYEPAASRLWDGMLAKKTQQASSCKLIPKTADRSAEFGNAIKLLYQYKSAVAMWNYLVRTRASKTEIIQAPQDYSGFIIQTKRSQDTCGSSDALSPVLSIRVRLKSGQTVPYLEEGNLGMGLYINKVTQNTYIQYGRDTGTADLRYDDVSLQVTKDSSNSSGIGFQARFTFSLDRTAPTFMSASLKVLPVIYTPDGTYSETFCLLPQLRQWVALRPYATTIDQALQTEKNVWQIQIQWNTGTEGDSAVLHEDFYYYTAYSKYPQESDSQSISN